jgi:Restriction endonuclease
MRAVGAAILLVVIWASAANAIGCLPGYVSIGCPPPAASPGSRAPATVNNPYPAAPADDNQTDAYRQGVTDWRTLQSWFDLQTGDRRAGADYWAGNRSNAGHKSCSSAASDYIGDRAGFAAGCEEAKRRLDPVDARRLADSDYRAGFSDGARQIPLSSGNVPPVTRDSPSIVSTETSPLRSGIPAIVPPSNSMAAPSQSVTPAVPNRTVSQSATYQSYQQGSRIPATSSPIHEVIFVVLIAAIGLLVVFIRYKNRKIHRERISSRVDNKIENLMENHSRALVRKRFQTLMHDDYGNLIWEPWQKEVNYFINAVIDPAIRSLGYEEYELFNSLRPGIFLLIDQFVQAQVEKVGAITFGPHLTPIEFEQFCAEQLRLHGWSAETTKGSGDQGSDIIAEKHGLRLVVQCKLYTHPVGNKAVQEIAAARSHEKADYAAVVTNNRFTSSARQLAATNKVVLLHHSDLSHIDSHLEIDEVRNLAVETDE